MAHGYGLPGLRCTAIDPRGIRCTKDFTHMDADSGRERWHDASIGVEQRRWR